MSIKLPVYELEPDENSNAFPDSWVYILYDAVNEQWNGKIYPDQASPETLLDWFSEAKMMSLHASHSSKDWDSCRKYIRKNVTQLKPYCYLIFNKVSKSDTLCVCSMVDLLNIGCPSARGLGCRSKV